MLLCRTPPIIESSTGLRFCCWNVGYAGLAAQLEAAGLSPFHNFWGHVHDFSRQEASWHFVDEAELDLRGEGFCKQRLPDDVEARPHHLLHAGALHCAQAWLVRMY